MRQGIQADFPQEALRKEGCYFFTLLRWAEIIRGGGFEYSNADILKMYGICVEAGCMEEDCFIVNPVSVMNFCAGGGRQFKTVYRSINKPSVQFFPIYLKKPGHGHFVLGDQVGVLWDSYDPNRPGAKDYKVDSYRVII